MTRRPPDSTRTCTRFPSSPLFRAGRKFGAAVVLTFQALGQMRHRYGSQIAESMLGCCNTKLFLQTIDSDTRQWASDAIGSQEIGRAHVCTPVTNAHLVCRLLLENNK